jgi:hypothetical protein
MFSGLSEGEIALRSPPLFCRVHGGLKRWPGYDRTMIRQQNRVMVCRKIANRLGELQKYGCRGLYGCSPQPSPSRVMCRAAPS